MNTWLMLIGLCGLAGPSQSGAVAAGSVQGFDAGRISSSGATQAEIPEGDIETTRITVDCAKDMGRLRHFWQMTGFTPARLLFEDDYRQMMLYLAAIPHGGITYVRPHDLLALVKVKDFGSPNMQYDWSDLDRILDFFVQNGFKPFFEIMGIPQGVEEARIAEASAAKEQYVHEEAAAFPEETRKTFLRRLEALTPQEWRTLSRDVALHCLARYGREEVRSWFFETWNEPEGYREALWFYYDACSAGLQDADPELKFGGPGTFRTLDTSFTGLLEHCDRGSNYFTGQTGTRMDFISVHEKGTKRSGQFTDGSPALKEWIDREIATIKYIRSHHPRFADALYVNNEADPKGGYFHQYLWYSTAYYPAVIGKYVDHHLRRITDRFGIETMISNDNAFTGDWGTRAHVTRFGDREQFELIKRPINAGFTMLSLLGDTRLVFEGPDLFSDVGVIATRRGHGQIALLVYNCNEANTRERHDDAKWAVEKYGISRIDLTLNHLPFDAATLVHFRIDKDHTNPYELWKLMGSPKMPSGEQFARIRQVQELALLEAPRQIEARDGKVSLEFLLPLPGVSLLLLTAQPAEVPSKVSGLRAERFQGLQGRENIMLIWQGLPCRNIRTYEVLHAASPAGPFARINHADLICTAYLHVLEQLGTRGYYKVRAVDYWGRTGPESEVMPYP